MSSILSLHYNFFSILIICLLFVLMYFVWKVGNKILEASDSISQEMNERLIEIHLEQKRTNKLLAIMGNIDLSKVILEEEQDEGARLYIGNVDYSVREQDLAKLFEQFGNINIIKIPVNEYTGRGRGFGFVTYYSMKDAENAVSLDGTKLRGRRIQVSFAK